MLCLKPIDSTIMVSYHCAQAVFVGFENFSTADIPMIVKLVFCISVFVWNACGSSSLRYLLIAAE